MTPVWLRMTYRTMETAVVVILLGFGVLIFFEGLRLGPGFGPSGPRPGFFPFALTVLLVIGTISALYAAYRKPDMRPFFEAREEVEDLLKVGIPMAIAMISVRWLGLYIMAGLYVGLFAFWYGKFRWWQALAATILVPVVMYVIFRLGFNLPMPQSIFYRSGILPV